MNISAATSALDQVLQQLAQGQQSQHQMMQQMQQSQQQMQQSQQQMQQSLQQMQQSLQQVQQEVQQVSQQLQQFMQHQGHNSAVIAARRVTNGSRNASDEPYEVVPMADLQHPPNWPVGLNRTALGVMNVPRMTRLLNDMDWRRADNLQQSETGLQSTSQDRTCLSSNGCITPTQLRSSER
eukprot:CAMPEP_0182816300 /NCGR_PEP_ID=MMETSP0006_2-20121128/10861_1 /TAXON_ID=97485 /ORGANISM="Prymnesium parvum, Strain Texoma1" /LENGTH=180 /DNA_ID=CAMNT_0024942577 /DNA_START=195 /DNA_END=738 /DNA_ORIENTATION=+